MGQESLKIILQVKMARGTKGSLFLKRQAGYKNKGRRQGPVTPVAQACERASKAAGLSGKAYGCDLPWKLVVQSPSQSPAGSPLKEAEAF